MKALMKILVLFLFIFATTVSAGLAEEKNSINDLAFLIGEWEGTATHHFPDDPDREKIKETVYASCEKLLNGSYIKCQSVWKSEERSPRNLVTFYNYHSDEKTFYTLFLYENWPGIARYPISMEKDMSFFVGFLNYENADGSSENEKIQWNFSKNKRKITAKEYLNIPDEDGVNWVMSFDFEWQKK